MPIQDIINNPASLQEFLRYAESGDALDRFKTKGTAGLRKGDPLQRDLRELLEMIEEKSPGSTRQLRQALRNKGLTGYRETLQGLMATSGVVAGGSLPPKIRDATAKARVSESKALREELKTTEEIETARTRAKSVEAQKVGLAHPQTQRVHEAYRARAESPRFLRLDSPEQEKVFRIIETTHPAGPEAGKAATSTIQALNTAKITGSKEAAEILAKRARITEPALIKIIEDKAIELGAVQPGRIPPKALRTEVASVKRFAGELEQATKIYTAENFKTGVPEGGALPKITGTTRMFGGGKVEEAKEIIAKAIKDPEAAYLASKEGRFLPKLTAAVKEAGSVVGKGALKKGGLYGGIAALLAMLMMKGKKEPEMSPAQQIQMAQQMGEVQQQQALTQSLVGSRGASAQKNLAQADLLRLQAMMSMGGGQRGLL